jgi:hypothetical protein
MIRPLHYEVCQHHAPCYQGPVAQITIAGERLRLCYEHLKLVAPTMAEFVFRKYR